MKNHDILKIRVAHLESTLEETLKLLANQKEEDMERWRIVSEILKIHALQFERIKNAIGY